MIVSDDDLSKAEQAEWRLYDRNVRILQKENPELPKRLRKGTKIFFGLHHGEVFSGPARLKKLIRPGGEAQYSYYGKVNGQETAVCACDVDLKAAMKGKE